MTSETTGAQRRPLLGLVREQVGPLKIIDLGASEIAGAPPPIWTPLLGDSRTVVIGFEPHREERDHLDATAAPWRKVLPDAIADGEPHEFRSCSAPMTRPCWSPTWGCSSVSRTWRNTAAW